MDHFSHSIEECRRGNYPEALDAINKHISENPHCVKGYLHKVQILELLARHGEVIDVLNDALEAISETDDFFSPETQQNFDTLRRMLVTKMEQQPSESAMDMDIDAETPESNIPATNEQQQQQQWTHVVVDDSSGLYILLPPESVINNGASDAAERGKRQLAVLYQDFGEAFTDTWMSLSREEKGALIGLVQEAKQDFVDMDYLRVMLHQDTRLIDVVCPEIADSNLATLLLRPSQSANEDNFLQLVRQCIQSFYLDNEDSLPLDNRRFAVFMESVIAGYRNIATQQNSQQHTSLAKRLLLITRQFILSRFCFPIISTLIPKAYPAAENITTWQQMTQQIRTMLRESLSTGFFELMLAKLQAAGIDSVSQIISEVREELFQEVKPFGIDRDLYQALTFEWSSIDTETASTASLQQLHSLAVSFTTPSSDSVSFMTPSTIQTARPEQLNLCLAYIEELRLSEATDENNSSDSANEESRAYLLQFPDTLRRLHTGLFLVKLLSKGQELL